MTIEYEVKREDLGALGEFYARGSAPFQRAVQNRMVTGALLFIVGFALVARADNHPGVWLTIGVVLAVWWCFYWPRKAIANVRAHMATHQRACLDQKHAIEIDPAGLTATCSITRATTRWAGIHSIEQTESHIFVMLDDHRGYVVPKTRMLSGDLSEFVETANRYRDDAQREI